MHKIRFVSIICASKFETPNENRKIRLHVLANGNLANRGYLLKTTVLTEVNKPLSEEAGRIMRAISTFATTLCIISYRT